MYKNLRPASTSVYMYTIVHESIRTLVETFVWDKSENVCTNCKIFVRAHI